MPAPGVDIDWIAGLFPVLPGPGGRVTLLFTDIAGFTRHAAALGDREAVRLVRRHDAAVLPAVRTHAGRIVKRLGDGVMVAFPSPAAALAAAVTMQRAAARRPPLRLRIGIHVGVARVSAGDLIGHHVNVASRIGDRARAGEILVSDAIRRAAVTLPVAFRPRPPLRTGGDVVAVFRAVS
jgi:adenylate cyclase